MSRSTRTVFNLPNGKTTTSADRSFKEWRKFAKPVATALGSILTAFDPGIQLYNRETKTSTRLETWEVTKLNEALKKALIVITLLLFPTICFADQVVDNGMVTFKDQEIKAIVRCAEIQFYGGCQVNVCEQGQKDWFHPDGIWCSDKTLTVQETVKKSTGREDAKIIGFDTRHDLLFVTWQD